MPSRRLRSPVFLQPDAAMLPVEQFVARPRARKIAWVPSASGSFERVRERPACRHPPAISRRAVDAARDSQELRRTMSKCPEVRFPSVRPPDASAESRRRVPVLPPHRNVPLFWDARVLFRVCPLFRPRVKSGAFMWGPSSDAFETAREFEANSPSIFARAESAQASHQMRSTSFRDAIRSVDMPAECRNARASSSGSASVRPPRAANESRSACLCLSSPATLQPRASTPPATRTSCQFAQRVTRVQERRPREKPTESNVFFQSPTVETSAQSVDSRAVRPERHARESAEVKSEAPSVPVARALSLWAPEFSAHAWAFWVQNGVESSQATCPSVVPSPFRPYSDVVVERTNRPRSSWKVWRGRPPADAQECSEVSRETSNNVSEFSGSQRVCAPFRRSAEEARQPFSRRKQTEEQTVRAESESPGESREESAAWWMKPARPSHMSVRLSNVSDAQWTPFVASVSSVAFAEWHELRVEYYFLWKAAVVLFRMQCSRSRPSSASARHIRKTAHSASPPFRGSFPGARVADATETIWVPPSPPKSRGITCSAVAPAFRRLQVPSSARDVQSERAPARLLSSSESVPCQRK